MKLIIGKKYILNCRGETKKKTPNLFLNKIGGTNYYRKRQKSLRTYQG